MSSNQDPSSQQITNCKNKFSPWYTDIPIEKPLGPELSVGHSHICSHLVTTVATCQPHEENLSQVVSKISGAFYVPPGGFHVNIDWSNVLTAAGFRLRSPSVNVPPACALAFWSFKYNVYTPSRNWHCRSTSHWLCWNSFVIAGSPKGHMLTAPS